MGTLALTHLKAAKCQAHVRGHTVRRLNRSEVSTAEVRRAINRVNTDRVGFCQLLAYLVFVTLTCALLRMQYSVTKTYEVDETVRRRAALIVAADGSEWHEVGLSPDQLFGWLNAAAVELYEQNEKVEVDLDKWASGDDGAAVNATDTDGRLGTRCASAEQPACCRYKAWARGVEAKDFERVSNVHDFGHMRIASPLFVKLNRRLRVPCAHHVDESDPLSKLFVDCYAETELNTSRLVRSSVPAGERALWQTYSEEDGAYVLAIDLGLFRLSLDQGLCELSQAQQFGWIDTAAREVTVEYASYNGHYELWTLTRLSVGWSLGGNPEVELVTLTAPLRNVYRRTEDWVRAAFEGVYVLMLLYFIALTLAALRTRGVDGWTLIDLCTHGLAVSNVVLWAIFATEAASFRMANYEQHQLKTDENGLARWRESISGLVKIEKAENDFAAFKAIQSLMLMCLAIRLFRFLSFHAQFSLVTATLVRAAASLVHFLVVFMIIVVLYAFIGHNLLGADLEQYSTMNESINSVLSMLTTDDAASFVAIRAESNVLGSIFHRTFFILSTLLLINVLLAILLDAYTTVSTFASTTNHIWVDIHNQIRLFRIYADGRRDVYAKLRHAEECLRREPRPRLALGAALALLRDRYELPSHIVWDIVLVLERRVNKDKVDNVVLDRLNAIGVLNREIVARMRRSDGEEVLRVSDASFDSSTRQAPQRRQAGKLPVRTR